VRRVRDIRRLRRLVGIGAPDRSLTPVSGMVAVTELVDRLAMITLLDAAIGPIKTRDRGASRRASRPGCPRSRSPPRATARR
jgi:hypothetical protein